MEEPDIRLLASEQLRAANGLFRAALHVAPISDEDWQLAQRSYEDADTLGAFVDGRMVGTAVGLHGRLRVPGGALVPMQAVSRVGVRADHTRRGVLTALMRAQLTGSTAPVATLRASEGVIYRRFGYGVATRFQRVVVDRGRAVLHADAPAGGRVREITDSEELVSTVPRLQHALAGEHLGGIQLPQGFRDFIVRRAAKEGFPRCAVHTAADGTENAFAVYTVSTLDGADFGHEMKITNLFAADGTALAELWRYLLGVDLVHRISYEGGPLDQPLTLLLADSRACAVDRVSDETWLRLVDVPAALAARTYGGTEPVVVAVTDRFLPGNEGRYLVGPDGAERTGRAAQLVLPVDALAAAYLGDVPVSALAAAGRVGVLDPAALPRADTVFASKPRAWCGTYF
ncbi:GNAT family N-acetyltransferase [Kutzneria viridogrisea]|uniref:Uncharacterized protein n=2 Tax=Kutzneria TaxID=43356 RepID=W5WA68_9PSEU|nr:GNAT family N-acetyltransferase [Kutzneria albida]AHH97822.1 hypothetical protein KALB_4460 [Kutzneria albida DSM 43870]MBA8924591.1 putative acetyltransferase [Kutzneria viridogrisea]